MIFCVFFFLFAISAYLFYCYKPKKVVPLLDPFATHFSTGPFPLNPPMKSILELIRLSLEFTKTSLELRRHHLKFMRPSLELTKPSLELRRLIFIMFLKFKTRTKLKLTRLRTKFTRPSLELMIPEFKMKLKIELTRPGLEFANLVWN